MHYTVRQSSVYPPPNYYIYVGHRFGFATLGYLNKSGIIKMTGNPTDFFKTAREANAVLLHYIKNLKRVSCKHQVVQSEPFIYVDKDGAKPR